MVDSRQRWRDVNSLLGYQYHKPRVVDYVLCYALYLILLAVSYVEFVIWLRTSSLLVGVAIDETERSPVYGLAIVTIGMALFAVVMAAEPYLRGGIRRGQLWRRFARLALPLAVAIALGVAIQELIYTLT